MKYSRNPNYVGEMMIYGSFALLVQRWEPWYVLGFMWSILFFGRMLAKDNSLAKKVGWTEYQAHSWMLPFKIGGSAILSFLIYSVFISISYFCYTNGGI